MERLTEWQRSHKLLRVVFPVVLALLLPLLRMEWVRSFIRWVRFTWMANLPEAERNSPQMASRLYAELLRLLANRGFARRDAQTPREFATSLASQRGLAPAVQEFTNLYVEARFGGIPCDAFRLRTLLEQIRTAPRPH